MFKKIAILMLVFVMIFSPVLTVSASEEEGQDSALESTSNSATLDSTDEQVEATVDEGNYEIEDEPQEVGEQTNGDFANELVSEQQMDTEEEGNSDQVEGEETDSVENSEDAAVEENAQEEQANENNDGTTEEQEQPVAEEEPLEEEVTEEDELEEEDDSVNLFLLQGTAEGEVRIDFNTSLLYLDLEAGLHNLSGNEIENKWIAFILPEGFDYPEDYLHEPLEGVRQLSVGNGLQALAVKVPDLSRYKDGYVNHSIPLVMSILVDNPNPITDLYLLHENTDTGELELVGTLNGEREIDFFSDVDRLEQGEYDIRGTLNGTTQFNKEKHVYELALDFEVTNDLSQELNGEQYILLEIPEGVMVIDEGDADYKLFSPSDFNFDEEDVNTQLLGILVPSISEGDSKHSFTIPLIGKTDVTFESDGVLLFKVVNEPVEGTFPLDILGDVNVDFSAMNQDWYFDGKAQLVEDFPGLDANQFGLRFAFNVQNLTLDDVDEVKVEFLMPDEITVNGPDDYEDGDIPDSLIDFLESDASGENADLDIEWDGNIAIVSLETMRGTEWMNGFFTALGESSESLHELEQLMVRLTLYKNGEERVAELAIPLEVVPYEGPGQEDPEQEEPEQENPNPEDPGQDDANQGNDGEDDNKSTNPDNNDESVNEDTNGENTTNENDVDNDATDKTNEESNVSNENNELPNTGSFFSAAFLLMVGALFMAVGGFGYFTWNRIRA